MARFDVYRLADDSLVLDLQSPLLDMINSRVVAPLIPGATAPHNLPRLHPIFEIDGKRYVLATHLITAVPEKTLIVKVSSLSSDHDRIVAATDMLFLGF